MLKSFASCDILSSVTVKITNILGRGTIYIFVNPTFRRNVAAFIRLHDHIREDNDLVIMFIYVFIYIKRKYPFFAVEYG
jgi:hypothetical protein